MRTIHNIVFAVFLLSLFNANSQTSVNLSPVLDGNIYSASPTSDYSTATVMWVQYSSSGPSTTRSYLEFDLSGIPENAIVTSATLNMYSDMVQNAASHPYYLQRMTSDWGGAAESWNNQPSTTTTGQYSISHAQTSSTGWHNFSVTSHVQYWVRYPALNYGWLMRLQSESGTTRGNRYLTNEYGTSSLRPTLDVEYVLPIEISATVTHSENGLDNGSISNIQITKGSGTYTSYTWLQFDYGTTSTIETGSSIANAEIDNLEPGLYLLTVTDDEGTSNYKYFLVGEEGETTTVQMSANSADTSSLYWEDTWLRKESADLNSGSYDHIYPYWDYNNVYVRQHLAKFKMDFDYLLDVNSADLYLNCFGGGWEHYRTSYSTNKTYVDLVTSDWDEYVVTWNTKPTTSVTVRDSIPQTTSTGYVERDDTLDLKPFVDYWQENPEDNFGFQMSIATLPTSNWARLSYGSSDHATAAYRPKFVLSYDVKLTDLIADFDDSTGLGSISFNAPNGSLPYTYIASSDTVPDFDSIWTAVKDSIPTDSVTFWSGASGNQYHEFQNLSSGKYFIKVFDSNGDAIYEENIYLGPVLRLVDSTGVLIDSDTIFIDTSGFNKKSVVEMQTLIKTGDDGDLTFEIVNLDGNVTVGLNSATDRKVSFEGDFDYGMSIRSNDTLHIIVDGDVIDSIRVGITDEITFGKELGYAVFLINGEEIYRIALPAEVPDYQPAILLKGANSQILYKGIGNWTVPQADFDLIDIESGQEKTTLVINSTNYCGNDLVSYQIDDVYSAWTTSGSSFPVEIEIPVGSYEFLTTWEEGSEPLEASELLPIGYPIIWNTTEATNMTVGWNNSLTPASGTGSIKSVNKTVTTSNWVEFKVSNTGIGSGYLSVGLADDEDSEAIKAHIVLCGTTRFVWFTNEGSVQDLSDQSDFQTLGNVLIIDNDLSIRFEQNGSTFTALSGTTELVQFTSTVTNNLSLLVEGEGDVLTTGGVNVESVTANFTFPPSPPPYVKLNRIPDGGYYKAFEGILYVEYDEEYEASDLIFNIYNEAVTIDESNSSMNVTGTFHGYGDNRLKFDFSGGNCIPNGLYLLEVINGKNEKRYLRFKMMNSGC